MGNWEDKCTRIEGGMNARAKQTARTRDLPRNSAPAFEPAAASSEIITPTSPKTVFELRMRTWTPNVYGR